MAKQRPTGLGVICLAVFLDLVGFSILFPLFADLMVYYGDSGLLQRLMSWVAIWLPEAGADQRAALFGGILLGLYSVLQFIAAPLWGRLSDRIGRRRVLLITVAGNTLGYLLWIVADSFLLLVLSRLICGLSAGNISVASAAVADVTTQENRTKGMGFLGMAFGFGFLFGPVIGGLSASSIDGLMPSGGLAWNPFSLAATVAAGLSLVNVIWIWRRFAETRHRRTDAGGQEPLGPGSRRLVLINLIFVISFAAMESTLVFLAFGQLHYHAADMVGIFLTLGLCNAAVQGGVVRRLAPRLGAKRLAFIGLLLLMPSYACLALLASLPAGSGAWLLYLGVAGLGLGSGFTMPSLSALVSLLAPADGQGAAMGRFRSAGALGRAIGPFCGALLFFLIDPAAPYWSGGAAFLLPLLLLVGIRPPSTTTGGDD